MHPVLSSELISFLIITFYFSSSPVKKNPKTWESLFSLLSLSLIIFSILGARSLLQWLFKMHTLLLATQDSLTILSLVITCKVASPSVYLGNSPLFPQGQVFHVLSNHSSIILSWKISPSPGHFFVTKPMSCYQRKPGKAFYIILRCL